MITFREILQEDSKNVKIPEISMNEKLLILTVGIPASGKSTFVNKKILPYNRNFKVVDSDSLAKILSHGNENIKNERPDLKKKYDALAVRYVEQIMKSNANIIYDSTGSNLSKLKFIANEGRKHGYKIIVIHIVISEQFARKQLSMRARKPNEEVLQKYFSRANKVSESNSEINPDKYYVLFRIDNKFKYYNFINGNFVSIGTGEA